MLAYERLLHHLSRQVRETSAVNKFTSSRTPVPSLNGSGGAVNGVLLVSVALGTVCGGHSGQNKPRFPVHGPECQSLVLRRAPSSNCANVWQDAQRSVDRL